MNACSFYFIGPYSFSLFFLLSVKLNRYFQVNRTRVCLNHNLSHVAQIMQREPKSLIY